MNTKAELFGEETNKEPFIPVVHILTEKHEDEQTWRDRWKHHPEFGKLVIARSLGVRSREVSDFFESAKQGSKGIREFMRTLKQFPEIESFSEMVVQDIPKPSEIVIGILRKWFKMVVGGPSKARKTWVMMDFAISVAVGVEWLGFKTVKGRVLYVNFELMRASFKDRTLKIARSKGVKEGDYEPNLDSLNLRGYAAEAKEIISIIEDRARSGDYCAIILEPTYKMLGNLKENDTGDMAQLMNEFEKLATKLGVALVFAAHFPKGDMNKRQSIDRIGGSGVFARDPDTIITMTELSAKERKQANKQAGKKEEEGPDQELSQMLMLLKGGRTHSEWLKEVQGSLELDKSKFNRRLKKLSEQELVEKKGDIYVMTKAGEDMLARWKEHLASEHEDQDGDDSRAEDFGDEIKPVGSGIYKLEFTLRDEPPQKPIAIQFGDWQKGDFVHHRVDLDLDEADGSGTDNNEVTCVEEFTQDLKGQPMMKVTCTKCNHSVEGYCETKAKPGNTRKYCLATMCEECPLGEQNRYAVGPDEIYNTFTYVVTGYSEVTEDNVDEIAAQLKTTPEDVWRRWEKLNRKHGRPV